jgi:hypothetical protein
MINTSGFYPALFNLSGNFQATLAETHVVDFTPDPLQITLVDIMKKPNGFVDHPSHHFVCSIAGTMKPGNQQASTVK